MIADIIALVLGLIGLLLGVAGFFTARGAALERDVCAERLRLQNEQVLAGLSVPRPTPRASSWRQPSAGSTAAIQTGTTGALTRAFEQITAATTDRRGTSMDALRACRRWRSSAASAPRWICN